MDELHRKLHALEDALRGLGGVAVAFSAGVDSTFLLKVAHDTLCGRAFAVTASACVVPARETEAARDFCQREGIEQILVDFDPLSVEGFADNPPDRCYHCKRALFARFAAIAQERGAALAEGSNLDDLGDYRPGLRAIEELGVASPLRAAGLTKADIRALSRELGLDTWDKPSFACLASRFAYGEKITAERLAMAGAAEELLRALGFRQYRVRVHGDLARIELPQEDMPTLLPHAAELDAALRGLGFRYASLDLGGYRSGSMNRALQE